MWVFSEMGNVVSISKEALLTALTAGLLISVHSSIDRYLDCFHVLTFVNNTAMSMGHTNLFETAISFPWGIYPEAGYMREYYLAIKKGIPCVCLNMDDSGRHFAK